MEKLKARLDELQDEMLSFIEKDSADLQAQIDHWNALRKDYVTQYYARKGLLTVGMHPILPMALCKEKAKKAIEMAMVLSSLQQSPFAKEPWTLSDTSQELWNTPPEQCFKKQGSTVRVIFDGEQQNEMQYVNWDRIYYETEDGWHVATGLVEHKGLYYWRDSCKKFYVDFATEAAKYGKHGVWEVVYQNVTFSPVDSVSSTTSECVGQRDCDRQLRGTEEGERQGESNGRQSQRHSPRSGRGRQRQRRRECGELPTCTTALQRSLPDGRQQPAPEEVQERPLPDEPYRQGQGRQVEAQEEAQRGRFGPRPEGLGVQRRQRRLPAHLPSHPGSDIPLLFLHGPANSLKCHRYRVLRNYSDLCMNISKCWSWVRGDSSDSRVTVAFQSTSQRQEFLQLVPFPPNITYTWGRISGL
ncbi:E2 protein [Rupicapra rupicapra papillomavirus 1]|uniref:Regulatory protein E2 n=1 Tax=Rupicapra rupicapra papillomavirus 1 TaxID=1163708 RepID=X2DAI5_9PAPI|nr:E2 protein [Rupicapra rupicapra papillomavirus 1]AHL46427.1 E2 protein [Rupicapra rupicapra papillomavirus 1]